MHAHKLLIPAVMLSASLGVSARIAPAPLAAADATPKEAPRTITPAVLGERAPESYPVPQRLQDYTDTEAAHFALRCTGSRCGSISGSDSGWDDSDQ